MKNNSINILSKLNSIYWHDGVFLEVQVAVKTKMSINLFLELYKDYSSPSREKVNIQFKHVENLVIITDTKQLLENRFAGNIDRVNIEQALSSTELKLSMNLFGGDVSFSFKDVTIINS